MKAIFDSNILIDSLNGIVEATRELDRHAQGLISVVTWIEVMAAAKSTRDADVIRRFLGTFECVHLDPEIAEHAAVLCQAKKLKLPDAVVLATAHVHHAILITRDADFLDTPGIRIPYKI